MQVHVADVIPETTYDVQAGGIIGNRAWLDLDFDGVQDLGEPGLPGITVNLYAFVNGRYFNLGSRVTDANGEYRFTVANDGSYLLHIIAPRGYIFTIPDAGFNDSTDSDFSPVTGATSNFFISGSEIDDTRDVGFVQLTSCELDARLDIALVLDGSGSISSSNFTIMQNFALGLVDSFAVGGQATRFSVTQFSSPGRTRFETRLTGNRNTIVNAIPRYESD